MHPIEMNSTLAVFGTHAEAKNQNKMKKTANIYTNSALLWYMLPQL